MYANITNRERHTGNWDIGKKRLYMLLKIVRETEHFFSLKKNILLSWIRDPLSTGNRTNYPLGFGTFPGKRDILSSGNDFFLWESDHLSSGIRNPLFSGIRDPLYLWDSEPLCSGILTTYLLGSWPPILWESDHLSSGIRNTYPLGFGPPSGIRFQSRKSNAIYVKWEVSPFNKWNVDEFFCVNTFSNSSYRSVGFDVRFIN